MLELLKADIKPRDIMTRAAFENAMTVVMALGGSTNAVSCIQFICKCCQPSACAHVKCYFSLQMCRSLPCQHIFDNHN